MFLGVDEKVFKENFSELQKSQCNVWVQEYNLCRKITVVQKHKSKVNKKQKKMSAATEV